MSKKGRRSIDQFVRIKTYKVGGQRSGSGKKSMNQKGRRSEAPGDEPLHALGSDLSVNNVDDEYCNRTDAMIMSSRVEATVDRQAGSDFSRRWSSDARVGKRR